MFVCLEHTIFAFKEAQVQSFSPGSANVHNFSRIRQVEQMCPSMSPGEYDWTAAVAVMRHYDKLLWPLVIITKQNWNQFLGRIAVLRTYTVFRKKTSPFVFFYNF